MRCAALRPMSLPEAEDLATLRETATLFEALFERSGVGVAVIETATGRILRVNAALCQWLGLSSDALCALDVESLTHPEDLPQTRETLERLLRADTSGFEREKRLRRADGSFVWVQITVTPLGNPSDARRRHLVVLHDITARRETEIALRESQTRLRSLFEQATLGVAEIDAATRRVLRANRRMCEVLGYPEHELVGRDFLSMVHPDDVEACLSRYQRLASGSLGAYRMERRYARKDGSFIWADVAIAPLEAPTEGRARIMGIVDDITERRQTLAALGASEERYRRLFEEAVDGICEVQLDGTIMRVNPAFARMVGYGSPEELVGTNVDRLYAEPDGRSRVLAHVGEGETIVGVDALWRRKDGAALAVRISGRVVRGERGEWSGHHAIVHDVSAQRQYDDAQRVVSSGLTRVAGEAFFEAVAIQLARIVGADLGFVGAVKTVGVPTIRTLGLAIDGIPQPPIEFALSGTPCDQVVGGHTLVVPSGAQALFPEAENLRAFGIHSYAAAPLLDASGTVFACVGVMGRKPLVQHERLEPILHLFAQRTAAELERQRAAARLSDVFDSTPDALVIVDDAGHILLANRTAEQMFGYSRAELLQLDVEQLVPSSMRRDHAALRRGARLAPGERHMMGAARRRLAALRKDGTTVPVEVSLSAVQSEEGQIVVAALRDVTERMRMEAERAQLEEQLRQAQRLESLGTLAGGIAHDFNNLLAAISANVELAREEVAPTHPVSECLDEIAGASTRARDLVRQILAFSRKQVTIRTVSAVRPVIEEVTRLLRATIPAGISIVSDLSTDVLASLDPTQIHQVLMNLGTNAWQAMERTTGRISFQLDLVTVEAERPPLAGMTPGRYARIRVSDDGKGMDEATRARIFEPFFTTKDIGKGTGLGLAVVHGIVSHHGGAIEVQSAPGRGATFSVYLPEAVGQARAKSASRRPASGGTERVLLIDDEDALLRTSKRVLERLGYEVTTHARPAEAVAAVREDPLRFDVVITDQSMPEMNGLEVVAAIRAVRRDLPILLISGNAGISDEELRALDVEDYVGKPFTGQALGEAVARVLGRG
jgi:PAS domain S-box-containing protein